jgi:uncharacterized protein YerC
MIKSPVSGEEFVRGYQKNRVRMVEVDFYRRACLANAKHNRPLIIKMLKQGRPVLEIYTATGVSIQTIYKIKKELFNNSKVGRSG